jgi:hypothetical protein
LKKAKKGGNVDSERLDLYNKLKARKQADNKTYQSEEARALS